MPRRAPRSLGGDLALRGPFRSAPLRVCRRKCLGLPHFFGCCPLLFVAARPGRRAQLCPSSPSCCRLSCGGGKAQGSGTNSKRGSGPKAVCLKGPYPALAWGKGWV